VVAPRRSGGWAHMPEKFGMDTALGIPVGVTASAAVWPDAGVAVDHSSSTWCRKMFERQGEITPPCGEPSVAWRRRPSSRTPAFSHLSIIRRITPSVTRWSRKSRRWECGIESCHQQKESPPPRVHAPLPLAPPTLGVLGPSRARLDQSKQRAERQQLPARFGRARLMHQCRQGFGKTCLQLARSPRRLGRPAGPVIGVVRPPL
jgi:hypothetical protein